MRLRAGVTDVGLLPLPVGEGWGEGESFEGVVFGSGVVGRPVALR